MSGMSELPPERLNSHEYQNVTATVVTKSNGYRSKAGRSSSGRCQPATSNARMAVAVNRLRPFCSAGSAYPRKLGSSLNGPLTGFTMCSAIASGSPYDSENADAPNLTLRAAVASWTASGTPRASAYQIQLTR